MKNYWAESEAFIKENWPKFTAVEIKRINGNYDTFLKYLKEYYGNFPLTEAIARDKLNKFYLNLSEG
ncbi:hypothetical protein BVY03_02900 [bacterium K02(2017)]|nr:hypothetical protein BVY03_02900 [bacterium K02(2017)]